MLTGKASKAKLDWALHGTWNIFYKVFYLKNKETNKWNFHNVSKSASGSVSSKDSTAERSSKKQFGLTGLTGRAATKTVLVTTCSDCTAQFRDVSIWRLSTAGKLCCHWKFDRRETQNSKRDTMLPFNRMSTSHSMPLLPKMTYRRLTKHHFF